MSTKYILEVKFDEDYPEDIKSHYTEYNCNGMDSGIDLIIPSDIICSPDKTTTINHKVCCQMKKYINSEFVGFVSYWLVPRSSISKTPYRMANSIGLIDSGYRGNLMAKVDTIPEMSIESIINHGTRMFQIAVGDLTPISEVIVVDELTSTERGSGGFGSTGK